MQNLWYLIAAYGVIWLVLFVYVFSISRRQERLREELQALEAGATILEPIGSDRTSCEGAGVMARQ